MLAVMRFALLLVEGLLFVAAARAVLEVLLVKLGLPLSVAALAGIAWTVALCLVTHVWQRQGAAKYSWLALLRALIMAAGMGPILVGAELYFRFDRHATALLVLSGAGLSVVAQYALVRIQRAEERRAPAVVGHSHAA
jgi:hypothetical protein